MDTDKLPPQGSAEAMELFLAMYESHWDTHPASRKYRQDDGVARRVREMWMRTVDSLEPRYFDRVFELVATWFADNNRRGKPKLADIQRAIAELNRAYTHAADAFIVSSEPTMSLPEYIAQYGDRHPGSPTVAEVRRHLAAPPPKQPPKRPACARFAPPNVAAVLAEPPAAEAPDPEPDYERLEREAIQSVEGEPW